MENSRFKFRAWSEVLKKMDYSSLNSIGFDGKIYFGNADITGFHNTIMQYTGLKDKNGVEIYEGDIVRFLWGSISFYAEVTFSKGAYVLKNQNTSELNVLRSEHVDLLLREVGNCEIIGDVYQNPELLEVE